MAIHMIGGGMGEAPFNRTFFNVTLGETLSRNGKEKEHRLTLYLTDGVTLDVCNIEDLSDDYVALKAFRAGEDACETITHLIPYTLIYRIEVAPKADGNNRVGFHWAPARKISTARRSVR